MPFDHMGFVGLFFEPLGKEEIAAIAEIWIERYGKIEQTTGSSHQILTLAVRERSEIIWEKNLQFRVLCGEQFAWIYVTENSFVIETSGLSYQGGDVLCRDVLEQLPGCREIIDEHNDKRLDQLEAEGLM